MEQTVGRKTRNKLGVIINPSVMKVKELYSVSFSGNSCLTIRKNNKGEIFVWLAGEYPDPFAETLCGMPDNYEPNSR